MPIIPNFGIFQNFNPKRERSFLYDLLLNLVLLLLRLQLRQREQRHAELVLAREGLRHLPEPALADLTTRLLFVLLRTYVDGFYFYHHYPQPLSVYCGT